MSTVADLISQGLIKVGDEIVFTRRSLKTQHRARIQPGGTIQTEDGAIHKSPSGAARHFTNKPIDGWNAWKIGATQVTLADLRAQLRD